MLQEQIQDRALFILLQITSTRVIFFSVDKNFIYGEPYAGPDIREMKGVLGENCSNFCQTGADQDCITSFLPHYNLCVVAGFTSKP